MTDAKKIEEVDAPVDVDAIVMPKKARNKDEAWKIQDQKEGLPHGWVQWKGTDVCMDIHCKCGELSHVDAEFAYYVKCSSCGTVYMCNGHTELIELEDEPDYCVVIAEA